MGLLAEEMTLERAYRVLGVSTDAPAHTIKQVNRKLVKRWHPDLYRAGTTEHSEASEMTRLINEAYSAIGHAPLRYQSRVSSEANYQREKSASRATNTATDETRGPRLDKIEFWTRFVCGALLGLFVAAYAAVSALSDAANLSVS